MNKFIPWFALFWLSGFSYWLNIRDDYIDPHYLACIDNSEKIKTNCTIITQEDIYPVEECLHRPLFEPCHKHQINTYIYLNNNISYRYLLQADNSKNHISKNHVFKNYILGNQICYWNNTDIPVLEIHCDYVNSIPDTAMLLGSVILSGMYIVVHDLQFMISKS